MSSIIHEVTIARPPSEVYTVLSHVERLPELSDIKTPGMYCSTLAHAIVRVTAEGEESAMSDTEARSQPDVQNDRRLDPRVKRALRNVPPRLSNDIDSRERLVEISNSPSAQAMAAKLEDLYSRLDTADVAPFDGLRIETREFASMPDGNTVKVQLIRPDSDVVVPGVVYLHGGGMQTGSCFNALYRMWGRLLAHQGLAVAMIDFRNCLTPSSAPEIEPFPAGLNDCVSGVPLDSRPCRRVRHRPRSSSLVRVAAAT